MPISSDNVVALFPAGGKARRLSLIPCSKEILPIGAAGHLTKVERPIKGVCHSLLDSLAYAGITNCIVVLDQTKEDIRRYLRNDGGIEGFHIDYHPIDDSPNTPSTLVAPYAAIKDKWVALGFPDMVLPQRGAFKHLLSESVEDVDVVIGLFPADQPENVDMVEIDDQGYVQAISIKPKQTKLRMTWGVALWGPRFTQFMCDFLATPREQEKEIYVGDVIIAALEQGYKVRGVRVSSRPYLDIGVPANYDQLFNLQRFLT